MTAPLPVPRPPVHPASRRGLRSQRAQVAGISIGGTAIVVAILFVALRASAGSPEPSGLAAGSTGPLVGVTSPSPTISTVPTSQLASSQPSPSPRASRASAAPPATDRSTILAAHLPVAGDARYNAASINVTPADHRAVLVSVPAPKGTVLVRLAANGGPAPGWPILLRDQSACSPPLAGRSGTVEILCFDDVRTTERAFAFDVNGKLRRGWPVDFPEGINVYAPRLVGDRLLVIGEDPGSGTSSVARVISVSPDGVVESGSPVESRATEWRMSPAGVAYGSEYPDGDLETRIVAFDRQGIRPGWPIRIDGLASTPGFAPGQRIVVIVWSGNGTKMRTLMFDERGAAVPFGMNDLPATPVGYQYGSARPAEPVVSADGHVAVLGDDGNGQGTVWSFDQTGVVAGSWPHPAAGQFTFPEVDCPTIDSICDVTIVPPVVGVRGAVAYVEIDVDGEAAQIVSLDPDGVVRPGWPVTLRSFSADFVKLVAGPRNIVYAIAVEREGTVLASASILAIAPDSTVLYVTTVIQP